MRARDFINEEAKSAKINGLIIKYAFNDRALILKAFEPTTKNPLAYVKFVKEGKELYPQDLWVNDDYRNRGIAKTMYDYLKSEGYIINRSHDQTNAGAGFWDKHRGEDVYVWEEEIDEIFEPGKDWEWSFKGSEEAVAVFHVGDIPYQFYAYSPNVQKGWWDVEFKNASRGNDRSSKFGLTGTGNSAEVMSTIADIMRAFLQEYQGKIKKLTFSAKELSRQTLYTRMLKRLLPSWSITQDGIEFTLAAPGNDQQGVNENFADGKNPQDKGDSKRHGVPTKASVSTLRKVAKQGGRKGQLAHWMANMKAGKAKKK